MGSLGESAQSAQGTYHSFGSCLCGSRAWTDGQALHKLLRLVLWLSMGNEMCRTVLTRDSGYGNKVEEEEGLGRETERECAREEREEQLVHGGCR